MTRNWQYYSTWLVLHSSDFHNVYVFILTLISDKSYFVVHPSQKDNSAKPATYFNLLSVLIILQNTNIYHNKFQCVRNMAHNFYISGHRGKSIVSQWKNCLLYNYSLAMDTRRIQTITYSLLYHGRTICSYRIYRTLLVCECST